MAYGRAYQAYQQSSVQTSSQKQLIVMLYDGMHRFMTQAVTAIEQGEVETAHHNLSKTGKILLELLGTLREDKGGVVATNLKKLYVYCYEQVVLANLKKDVASIQNVQKVVENLREGWKELNQASRKPNSSSSSQQIQVTG